MVPRDEIGPRRKADPAAPRLGMRSAWRTFPPQFYLAWLTYFLLFTLPLVLRLVTPIALRDVEGEGATAASGIVFTISGIASVVGVFVVGGRYMRPGRMRSSLIVACLISAAANVLLLFTEVVPLHVPWYVLWFAIAALLQGAMMPATNTLLASTVGRERRGTAFGFAGSAIALALIVGPIAGAGLVAIEVDLVFVAAAVVLVGLAMLLFVALREPELESEPLARAR
jgi:MFS family permease